jgi:hypothetical protein
MRYINKAIAIITALSLSFLTVPVYAASLTSVSDTMTRMTESQNSNHTILFTTAGGLAAGQNFTITFPTGFTMASGIDYTDVDVVDDSTDLTLAAIPSGATWGAAFGGTNNLVLTVTSGSGTIAGSSIVTVRVGLNATAGDKQVQNHATHGTYLIAINVNAGTDTGSLAVAITDADQFTVTAGVDPSITFTLNDVAVSLGTLTVSQVYTDTTTFTVNTNSATGYSVTATEDGNLRTSTADINDVADGTVTLGNEEYGMSTSKSAQDFLTTGANAATAIDGTAKHCASSAGTASSDITTLTLLAAVAGDTPAGAYSHIVTLIATGNF